MKQLFGIRPAILLPLALIVGSALSCGEARIASLEPAADVNSDIGLSDVSTLPDLDATSTDASAPTQDVPSSPSCKDDGECILLIDGQTPCSRPKCVAGHCTAPQALPEGSECSNPSLLLGKCELSACDAKGACAVQSKKDGVECGAGVCGEICVAGKCEAAPADHYEDDNPCTIITCDQGQALKTEKITNLSMNCDDNNPCTNEDACIVGQCVGQLDDCDDNVPCTKDECHPINGCTHTPVDSACTNDNPCVNMACSVTLGCAMSTDKPYNKGASCEDGDDKCTPNQDTCDDSGVCGGVSVCVCAVDEDCKSQQTDACTPLKCVNKLCTPDLEKKIKCDTSLDGFCAKTTCDPKTGQCNTVAIDEGKECNDNDKCTSKSSCLQGVCTGPKDKKCDDGLECTLDTCQPFSGCVFEPGEGECDDKNPCTENDACSQGACSGTPMACDDGLQCTYDSCDPKTGKCANTPKDTICEDNNPCTEDKCVTTKGCESTPKTGVKCDDGDKCTEAACGKSGKCDQVTKYNKTLPGCGCQSDNECTSPSACVAATCKAGDCVFDKTKLNGQSCETGDKCHLAKSGTCDAGACTGGKSKDCSSKDGKCQIGVCDSTSGECVSKAMANNTACDADGSKCTPKDTCQSGKCVADVEKDCSALTKDCKIGDCTPSTGKCVANNVKDGETCDDGDFCTVLDKCKAGVCNAGSIKTCSEMSDACNKGTCDSKAGACKKVPKAKGTPCDDGQYCNEGETCNGAGQCAGGKAKICPNNYKICKMGVCDEKQDKCLSKPADAVTCDDDNKCTLTDKCFAGVCKGSNPKNCDATGDACNTGVCSTATGACVKKPKATGTACSDGNACTLKDSCSKGICKAGAPKNCDDGDACTVGDQCVKGNCVKGAPKSCDDKNACTLDTCTKGSGVCGHYKIPGCGGYCVKNSDCKPDTNICTDTKCLSNKCSHVPNTTACDDGNKCTLYDKCYKGICKSGMSKLCAKKTCQSGNCVSSTGLCLYKATPNAPCSDGNKCTYNDKCSLKASCIGIPIKCNDGKLCTSDSCSILTGKCQFIYNTLPCSDGNACTLSDKCYKGTCKPGLTKSCKDSTKCTADSCNTKTGACFHSPIYEGSTCEQGSYSTCHSGACVCKLYETSSGNSIYSDYLYGVAPVSDGGVIAVGRAYNTGMIKSYDGWITRRDKYGKLLWSKLYSGGLGTDELRSVVKTKYGTYLAVGHRYDAKTKSNCGWALEIYTSGSTKRSITFCQGSHSDYLRDVVMDKYGKFYAVGYTYSSGSSSFSAGWVVKINLASSSGGYMDWKKTYDAFLVVPTGGFPPQFKKIYYHRQFNAVAYSSLADQAFTAGSTNFGSGGTDGQIMALKNNGDVAWSKNYGGKNNESFNTIVLNPSYSQKYLFAAGSSYIDSTYGTHAWIVRANRSDGKQISTYHYGAKSNGVSAWYGATPYGSGVQLVGSYWDGKYYKGWMMRTSYAGYKYGDRTFSNNSYLYDITTVNGLYQAVGRRAVKSYDGFAVQANAYGQTVCK